MKADQLAALFVRFFVIYVLLIVVFQYGLTLSTLIMKHQHIGARGSVILLTTFFVLLAILGLLWRYALRIAQGIMPKGDAQHEVPLSLGRLEILGFSLIGLWAIVDSFPDILQYGIYISSLDAASARTKIAMYGHITQFMIGFGLFIGAKRLVQSLRALRDEG